MSVRIGVDVGGTFTKAVAVDMSSGELCARATVPTTHMHADGVAAGVVEVVAELASQLGAERIDLVTHSTTQAVNALLEGDVGTVGMVGMGTMPDLRKARSRTVNPRIDLADGHRLTVTSEFIDVTNGLDASVAKRIVDRLLAAGATSIAAAAAYSTDDTSCEDVVAAAAHAAGVPVTTSAELTGLYGLELRAVTAALNASILPIALHTARVVREGVRAAGITCPIMVMRGDAGATDLNNFERHPARTLFSGPAASVAGAVRTGEINDAVIVEVGGTSSNIAPIRRGRPALSYVKVASHATALRALDVQVVGVAGGSMLRVRRNRVYGVGPRSAHIGGFPYACFESAEAFAGATFELVAPLAGDRPDYAVIQLADGRRVAPTLTCAANALGFPLDGDYARGDQEAAIAAFDVVGSALGVRGLLVAERMIEAAVQVIGDVVTEAIGTHKLENPTLVALGGGAGGLGRAVAEAMRLPVRIPEHAEVISALGDALSLIRTEHERTLIAPTPEDIAELVADAELEAIAAGAAAASLEVQVDHLAERNTVRVVVTGAVGLASGARAGRDAVGSDEVTRAVAALGLSAEPRHFGEFWLADGSEGRVVVLDRYGDVVVDANAEIVTDLSVETLEEVVKRRTRGHGALTTEPSAWLIAGRRLIRLPSVEAASMRAYLERLSNDDAALLIGTE